MKVGKERRSSWKRRFAYVPVLGQWLVPYWSRNGGDFTEISFDESDPGYMAPREREIFDAAWKLLETLRGGGTPPFMTQEQAENALAKVLTQHVRARN